MRVSGTSVRSKPRHLVRTRALAFQLLQPGKREPAKQLIRRPSGLRRLLSCLLILAGSALCSFVAASYVWMYVQQRLLLHEWNVGRASAPQKTLTKLSIPRIHLEDVVLEGASGHSLLLGPAHLAGSALPGDPGNAVIAGHRDTFFRHIHSLKYGDDIYILRSGKRLHYVVRTRRIVEPDDLSVLEATQAPQLTLITCYPTHAIGPAPQRLIVVAKMAGSF